MAAAKLLIDRVIPSRRGAPVSFHIRPLKTPDDCALAYTDLLDDVGGGRLTPPGPVSATEISANLPFRLVATVTAFSDCASDVASNPFSNWTRPAAIGSHPH